MDKDKNLNVYVSGLPLDTTQEEFVEIMSKYGIVMVDEDGTSVLIIMFTASTLALHCENQPLSIIILWTYKGQVGDESFCPLIVLFSEVAKYGMWKLQLVLCSDVFRVCAIRGSTVSHNAWVTNCREP